MMKRLPKGSTMRSGSNVEGSDDSQQPMNDLRTRRNQNNKRRPPLKEQRRNRVPSVVMPTHEPISFLKRTVNRLQHPLNDTIEEARYQRLGIQAAPFILSFPDDSSAMTSPSSIGSSSVHPQFVSPESQTDEFIDSRETDTTPDSLRIGIQRNPTKVEDKDDFPDHLSILSADEVDDEVFFDDPHANGLSLFEDAWMSDPEEEDEEADMEDEGRVKRHSKISTSSYFEKESDHNTYPTESQSQQTPTSSSGRSITKTPIRDLLKSIAQDIRRKPRDRDTACAERVKSVKIRNQGASSALSPRRSSTTFENIYVLLLNPLAKIFELIQLSYFPLKTTVGDIVNMIPKHVTEPSLASQLYVGLTRPRKRSPGFTDLDLCVSDKSGKESASIVQGEILIALPDGYTRHQIVRLAKKILANPRIQKLVVDSEKISNHNKKSTHSPKVNKSKPKTPRVTNELDTATPITPEALEITRLATELACEANTVVLVSPAKAEAKLNRRKSTRRRSTELNDSVTITTPERKTKELSGSNENIIPATPSGRDRYANDEFNRFVGSPANLSVSTTQSTTESFLSDLASWNQNLLLPGHPLLSSESTTVFSNSSWSNSVSCTGRSGPSFANLNNTLRQVVRPSPRKAKSKDVIIPLGNVVASVFFAMLIRYFTDVNGYGSCLANIGEEPMRLFGLLYTSVSFTVLVKLQKFFRRSKFDWSNDQFNALHIFRILQSSNDSR